jgi:hypothetical protein
MNDQHIDQNLKYLMRKAGLINPSPDFTHRVMERIHQMPVEKTQISLKADWIKDWVFFSSLGIAGALATAWYFISYNNNLLFVWPKNEYWPLFEKITDSLSAIFSSFRVSSITVAVIGAILLVFVTDLVIKKIQSFRKVFLFL